MADSILWGLHHSGGENLVDDGVLAVGWVAAGDLTGLPADREAFKEHLRPRYPDKSEGWIPGAAGQLLRFRHVMQPGQIVAYPQKSDHTINIGKITSDYSYEPDVSKSYPHRRKVEWIKTGLPRETFSQGCLYELGAAMSVFTVKTHRDELLAAVDMGTAEISEELAPSKAAAAGEVVATEDEPTAGRIAELTQDYILRTFNTELKGHPFAEFCGWLLEALGYSVQVSRRERIKGSTSWLQKIHLVSSGLCSRFSASREKERLVQRMCKSSTAHWLRRSWAYLFL